MEDLWGREIEEAKIEVNIYADEITSKKCPYSGNDWYYVGIVVENLNKPLLNDVIRERFCGNLDPSSPYFEKNNKRLHWTEIRTADVKHICKRWFEYIVNPRKSADKFYCSILGLNDSLLNEDEFDPDDDFNSKYNRFFRSCIKYALKCFFGNNKIVINHIYHEQGQQQHHKYFPWHVIYRLQEDEPNFVFKTNRIEFLPKDHRLDERSNIIQLCDCFLGAVTTIIHGFEKSKGAAVRQELLDIILPLVQRMVHEPFNKNSRYRHSERIMIRFFPKERTSLGDIKRYTNQFHTFRRLKYEEDKSGQMAIPV